MQPILNGAAKAPPRLMPAPHAPAPTPPRSASPPPRLDPYADVEVTELAARDGMTSGARSVRIADSEADTGWREAGIVSPNYLLVRNRDAQSMAHAIADRSGLPFREHRTIFDGKRYALVLTATEGVTEQVRVGDVLGLGLMLRNSYDGSERLSASVIVYRLLCGNGMVAGQLFHRVAFRHGLRSSGWQEELGRSMAMLSAAPAGLRRFAEAASRLSRMELTAARLKALRKGPLAALPLTVWARALDRTLLHEEATMFGLLNGGTNTLWHAERPSLSDLAHNEAVTSALISFAESGVAR
jgi:hypothetical protein